MRAGHLEGAGKGRGGRTRTSGVHHHYLHSDNSASLSVQPDTRREQSLRLTEETDEAIAATGERKQW
jgi:hypothetical protein